MKAGVALLLILASCGHLAPAGGLGSPDQLAAELVRLAGEQGRAMFYLRELCTAAPRRLSGTADGARAVAWGLATMRAMGLQRVRAEPVTVPYWIRGEVARLELSAEPSLVLPITALGGSGPTPVGGLEAEVLMVRSVAQLKELGEAVAGKIVFFNRPMNPRLRNTFIAYGRAVGQRSSGPVEARKLGAVAAVVRSMTTSLDDFPHTGSTGMAPGTPKIPAVAVSTKGANALAERIRRGPVRLRLEVDCHDAGEKVSANVVADWIGYEHPEEIVLIGGHLDSWDLGQGAHDDGAGIAHCLGALDLLRRAGFRPRRTIRVVMFMNEESGLRGARAYPEQHADEIDKHVAAIESDRGGFEPRGFSTSARGARLAELKNMVEPLRALGMGAMIPGGGGPDIAPLGRLGVEMFALVPESKHYFDYHHSAKDLLSNVDAAELERGAVALAFLVARLCQKK